VQARAVIPEIYVDDKVKDYIVSLVFATREPAKAGLKDLAHR
jgi:MoxR-like ATPase